MLFSLYNLKNVYFSPFDPNIIDISLIRLTIANHVCTKINFDYIFINSNIESHVCFLFKYLC